MLGFGRMHLGLDFLHAIRRPLFESAASLDQQLVALRQQCGGSSSGAGSNLPTAGQLQAAWAALVIVLVPAGARQGQPKTELAAIGEQAARALLAHQPDSPRSSYEMGNAAAQNARAGLASSLGDPLLHYQRGIELARAQGSDFWLARWAGCVGLAAVFGGGGSAASGLCTSRRAWPGPLHHCWCCYTRLA